MTVVDRALVGSFAAVVSAFVGSTIYGELRAGKIDEQALSIQGTAAPAIRRLANASAELRRLQLLVHRALDDGTAAPARLVEIGAGRSLLDGELREYQHVLVFPPPLHR